MDVSKQENVEKVKYDPSKMYRWERDQKFEFGGEAFGVIINSLRATLSTPEAQRILLAEKALNFADLELKRLVEEGVIKEVPNEPKDLSILKKL